MRLFLVIIGCLVVFGHPPAQADVLPESGQLRKHLAVIAKQSNEARQVVRAYVRSLDELIVTGHQTMRQAQRDTLRIDYYPVRDQATSISVAGWYDLIVQTPGTEPFKLSQSFLYFDQTPVADLIDLLQHPPETASPQLRAHYRQARDLAGAIRSRAVIISVLMKLILSKDHSALVIARYHELPQFVAAVRGYGLNCMVRNPEGTYPESPPVRDTTN